ncbi:MAG: beta-N-acetylhexosaminidase [Prolixibacteraceae bacterium]|jgi:hexosaminidase|nr:beta-N-acetylhexosaminidase [Prolixibacteraceae bacterium]
MKDLLLISILIISLSPLKEPVTAGEVTKEIQIIPMPSEIIVLNGTFEMTGNTSIQAGHNLLLKAEQLRAYLSPASGYKLPINKESAGGNYIELKLSDELLHLGDEGYQLNITHEKVLITAYNMRGIFWGIQTLRQLFPHEILREATVDGVKWILPCVNIVDKPRFSWRGLMIDYSRTFWNTRHTKKYIDAMAYYKLNKLHMHLTDDQGWRIEIDKYSALTEKASKFDTIYHEPKEREGFYLKEDIRELVRYAEARNVEIIPEIEMPGHTSEVFAAYPELSCTGETLSVSPFFKGPGIQNVIFCAGKERTFGFLENVLSEIIELFPSKYVHIGGDEAPKEKWKACPDCQGAIKKYGLKDEDELQSWFTKRIEVFLNSKGKKLIGWDEISQGGLSKTATVMFWRGGMENIALAAITQGNDVIMAPTSHCYFDYSYKNISTEKVYTFEPLSDKLESVNPEHILGVEACFWSHIDRTEPKMDRQIFPRILALAEVGWTESPNRNWDNFSLRLKHQYKSLDLMSIYYMDTNI